MPVMLDLNLKFLRLLLVEIEQRLCLSILVFCEASWTSIGLLVHVELLLAKLMLRGQLVGGALRLLIGQTRDDAQVVERLVGLGLQLVLRIVGIHLRGGRLLVHHRAFKRGLKALVIGLRGLERQPARSALPARVADRQDP